MSQNVKAPLTIEEVVRAFGDTVSYRAVFEWCRKHQIPATKLGDRWYVSAKWVDEKRRELGMSDAQ